MPIYVTLSTLTDKGRKTIQQVPERIRQVNKEVEAMGAKVLDQYALLGPYDFVNFMEAPDNETISRIISSLGARGTHHSMIMPAIAVDDYIQSYK